MSNSMSVTEARAALPRLLELVQDGEEVTLTRRGEPVAVVVRPDMVRSRGTGEAFILAEKVRALRDESGRDLDAGVGLDPAWAEELIAEVRASRDSR